MTEWTSLSVTEEQKADLEAAQEQAGHDGAIGRFLVREVTGDGVATSDVDIDETRKAAKQAEANTEEIKRQLEAIQGARV